MNTLQNFVHIGKSSKSQMNCVTAIITIGINILNINFSTYDLLCAHVCALTGCNLVITHSQWCFICCHNRANYIFLSISMGKTFPYLWLIGAKVTQPDAKFRICFRSFWEVFDQFVATTIQPFVEIFKRKLVHSGNFLRSRSSVRLSENFPANTLQPL